MHVRTTYIRMYVRTYVRTYVHTYVRTYVCTCTLYTIDAADEGLGVDIGGCSHYETERCFLSNLSLLLPADRSLYSPAPYTRSHYD